MAFKHDTQSFVNATPNPLVIIHHQVDNYRHHLPHDFGTLGYLTAVEAAVPGGAAMQFKDGGIGTILIFGK